MRNLLKSALGVLRGAPRGADSAVFATVLEACGGLDSIEPGLARKVAGFVAAGSGSSVLATLGKHASQVADALGLESGYYQLKVMQRRGLHTLLTDEGLWNLDAMHRFAQVVECAAGQLSNSNLLLCGTQRCPGWLRVLLARAQTSVAQRNGRHEHESPRLGVFTVPRIRQLLALAGTDEAALLDCVFHPGVGVSADDLVDELPGVEALLRDEPALVMTAAQGLDAHGRARLVHAVARLGLTADYFDYLFERLQERSKRVREAAASALRDGAPERLVSAAAALLESGTAGNRAALLDQIAAICGEAARPLLTAQLEVEKNARARLAAESALATLDLMAAGPVREQRTAAPEPASGALQPTAGIDHRGFVALDGSYVELLPRPPLPDDTPVPETLFQGLEPAIERFNQLVTAEQAASNNERHHWSRYHKPISAGDLKVLRQVLAGSGGEKAMQRRSSAAVLRGAFTPRNYDAREIQAFYASPEITLWHLLRLVASVYEGRYWNLLDLIWTVGSDLPLLELRRRLGDDADLRIVAQIWARSGGHEPLRAYLERDYRTEIPAQGAGNLWLYVAERHPTLEEALGMRAATGKRTLHTSAALELLAHFPKVPRHFLPRLMQLATGSAKRHREPARALLAGAPDIDAAIAALLADGKQDVRAGAADWLSARRAEAQIPALVTALAKERSELARAAIITALDSLGHDVSRQFDPGALAEEARKGLAKTKRKNLEWFPFEALPPVRLASGAPLHPDILHWWVVLANKLKQPGGNALFELYLDRLDTEDAERLGLTILRAWIERDTLRPSDAAANAYASANAQTQLTQMRRWIKDLTLERVFADLKSAKASEYLHSAIANKGLLGLTTRAPGADAAACAQAYLKNHGGRTAQCKALMEALAANPAPTATQVVLATANRFKAHSVQSHAQSLIETVAERRGWTAEELADRTIPTAGLDELGELALDCGGDRVYRLLYDADSKLTLLNPAGKVVKALPSARDDGEAEQIKLAKKSLSQARKALKQVNQLQHTRLFEAMCTQRIWPLDEWHQHLHTHPLVGRMCQRLVWQGLDTAGNPVRSFRPLDDGSLCDADDEAVETQGMASVRLAHQTLLPAAERGAWRQHLEDYEVDSLFDQLGRPLLTLAESQHGNTAISDREGFMIESFKLRTVATRLGYQRGEAVDGGFFTDYVKRYEGAGLVVSIEFTGSPLPEENIPCAIAELRFYALDRSRSFWTRAQHLEEVPDVLLSESWNDYHEIAAAGTGFDPDWQKQAGY